MTLPAFVGTNVCPPNSEFPDFIVPTTYLVYAEHLSISYIDHTTPLAITWECLVLFLPSATSISVAIPINI